MLADRLRRPLALALRLLWAVLAGALLVELACRFLVLSEVAAGWPLTRELREPSRYGSQRCDDLYWEMQFRALPRERRVDNHSFHPELGWTGRRVRPPDLAHVREAAIGERRPILLFGDSYADGVPSLDGRADFGTLLEGSPLSEGWILLNYGAGGYGFDQILMMMRRAVDRHRARSPVVVVSLLVDDDIDRCVLSFRSWPKPRLRLADGAVEEPDQAVPRVAEYLAEHSALPRSLAWHLIARGLRGPGASGRRPDLERLKQEYGSAILRAMVAELRAADLQFVFLLFLSEPGLERPDWLGWRERLVTETLDGLRAPWVSVRPAFQEHARLSGRRLSGYFVPPDAPFPGHYDVLGNRVAFEAILEGLRAHLGIGTGGDLGRVELVEPSPELVAEGADAVSLVTGYPALEARGLRGPFAIFQPRDGAPGEGAWRLLGTAARLTARAALVAEPADAQVVARLLVEVDGQLRETLTLQTGRAPVDLEVDLHDARLLRLRCELVRSSTRVSRLVLERFQLLAEPDRGPIVPALR